MAEPERQPSRIFLNTFSPAQTPALISFLNRALDGRRYRPPVTTADFAARVLDQPGFDPAGLILAWSDGAVIGGAHAIKPSPQLPTPGADAPAHHIAWLAVAPEYRRQGVGSRLLQAAENYLYYCPVHFAARGAPFYGIVESLWPPWRGSTEHMGVSALNDRELAEWLGKRGYQIARPGDVSLRAALHNPAAPADPGPAACGLRLVDVSERSPWIGETPPHGRGQNGGRPYQGLLAAIGDRAVGGALWYPLPDDETAALVWIASREPDDDAFLLDLALHRMARQGYLWVETHIHSRENTEAYALLRSRGFQVVDYWVNLVKT